MNLCVWGGEGTVEEDDVFKHSKILFKFISLSGIVALLNFLFKFILSTLKSKEKNLMDNAGCITDR